MPGSWAMRALAVLLLLAVIPPAQAQSSYCAVVSLTCQTTLKLEIVPPERPLPADGGLVALPVKVTYIANVLEPPEGPEVVGLRVTAAPSWLLASVDPGMLELDIPWPGPTVSDHQAEVTGNSTLLLRALPDAPAFTQGTVELQADAAPADGRDASTAKSQIPVEVGFRSALALVPGEAHVALNGGEARLVPVELRGDANGDLRVALQVAHAPPGLEVTVPEPIVLGHGPGAPTSKVVNVRLEAGALFDTGDVLLRATSAYAFDANLPGAGAEGSIHVARGHDDSVTTATLGAEPVTLMPLALGAATLLVLVGLVARKLRG